jgi:hypothetical protein
MTQRSPECNTLFGMLGLGRHEKGAIGMAHTGA